MKKLLLELLIIIIVTSCNNEPKAKKLIVGGVAVNPPENSDTTIVIQTKDTIYTVTFNSNGGTTETSPTITKSLATPVLLVDTTATSPGPKRKNLMLQSTFDDVNPFAPFYHPTQSCCAYSLTASAEKARTGNKSLRVELYKTDATIAASKRAELYPMINDSANVDRWAAASYYFPIATFANDKDPDLIMQWHTSALAGSPPLELRIFNGNIEVQQCIDASGGATVESKYFSATTLKAVPYDRWVDIVVHYKQSTGADGLVEVWIDEKKVYSKPGPNTFNFSNYFKIGINKYPWMPDATWGGNQTKRLFYIDEIRYGNEKATYKDVKPGD